MLTVAILSGTVVDRGLSWQREELADNEIKQKLKRLTFSRKI